MSKNDFTYNLINQILPFYLVYDSIGKIEYASPAATRLFEENNFSIKLTRPFPIIVNRSVLEELVGMVLFFEPENNSDKKLKGQSIIWEDKLILVGSPLVASVSELEKFQIKLTELPIHDFTGDLLLSIETNRISLNQAKESNLKLEEALEVTKKLSQDLASQVEFKTLKYKQEKEIAEKALLDLQESRIALSRAERDASLTQIVTHLAHEINNPLNYILTGKEVLTDSLNHILSTINEALSSSEEGEEFLQYLNPYLEEIKYSITSIEEGSFKIKQNINELRGITQVDGEICIRLNLVDEVKKAFTGIINKNKYNLKDWILSINGKPLNDNIFTNNKDVEFFGNPFILSFALRVVFDFILKRQTSDPEKGIYIYIEKIINLAKTYVSISIYFKDKKMLENEKKELFSLHAKKTGFGELINLGMMRELIRKSGGFLSLDEDGTNGKVGISLYLTTI